MSQMKIICAFLIVAIHAKFATGGRLAASVHHLVSEGLCRIAVPFFFFAAGYFMARHMGEEGWWGREFRKRIRTVLAPGVVFLATYIAISYGLNWVRGASLPSYHGVWADFGLLLGRTPLLVPTWYIRAFMIIVALSPLVWRMFGKCGRARALGLLAAMATLVFLIRPFSDCSKSELYHFLNYGLSMEGLLYFSAGVYLRWHPAREPKRGESAALFGLGLLLFALKFAAMLRGWPQIGFRLGFFAIPATLVGLYFLLTPQRLPAALAKSSFPVYLIHVFVLSAIGGRRGVKLDWAGFLGWKPHVGVARWAVLMTATFAVSILIAIVFETLCPRASAFLFGGRTIGSGRSDRQ